MKKLHDTLTEVFLEAGYNCAYWGQDEVQPVERDLRIEVVEQSQLEPLFTVMEATLNIVFLQGDWATNASRLSDTLMTFIPMADRVDDETKQLPDNSDKLTLLEVPKFSEISVEYNEETAEEEHSVTVSIFYQ